MNNDNKNIIASFCHTDPWDINSCKLIASICISDNYGFKTVFMDGDFKPKELDKTLNNLQTGIYFRLIIVKDIPGLTVDLDNLRETKLKNLRITYLDYASFFSHKFQNLNFKNLIGYTTNQQTIVIFYDTNWDKVVNNFRKSSKTIIGVEPSQPETILFLNRNQYRLSIFLFSFFPVFPDPWLNSSHQSGTINHEFD